jgi:hypothetical protein
MVRTLPPVVGVKATLVTAHRLLNNPLSAHASSLVVEQWSHDIDQLIVSAINTPHHEGGRQEPRAAHLCSPQLRVHCHLCSCLIRCACCQASRWPTSTTSSSAITWERIVTSPSSTTVRGATTSRAATSSEILNLLRQHERCLRHMLCIPLALQQALAEYGACTTSPDGSLAMHVLGWLTPPNSCRSTPPPSLLQEEMSSSWPTILWSP